MTKTTTEENQPNIDSAFLSLLQLHRGGENQDHAAAGQSKLTIMGGNWKVWVASDHEETLKSFQTLRSIPDATG